MMNTFEVPQEIKNRIDMIADHVEVIKSVMREERLKEYEADNAPQWKVLQYALYSLEMNDFVTIVGALKQTLRMKEEDFKKMAEDRDTTIDDMLSTVMTKMIMDLLKM